MYFNNVKYKYFTLLKYNKNSFELYENDNS